jgi:hypothetical protein
MQLHKRIQMYTIQYNLFDFRRRKSLPLECNTETPEGNEAVIQKLRRIDNILNDH